MPSMHNRMQSVQHQSTHTIYHEARSQLGGSGKYQKSLYTAHKEHEESKYMSMAHIDESQSEESSDCEDVDEEGSI